MLAGATINAVFAFGEELGWRGFLQRELASLGFWKASVTIGVIWRIWHAPLILLGHNYPPHPILGVALMTAFCVLASPLLAWITLKARSVVAAAVAHGTLNGTAAVSFAFLTVGHELVLGITGAVGMAVTAVAVALLWGLTRGQTARDWRLAYGRASEKLAVSSRY
jgi:uncharacterized protein